MRLQVNEEKSDVRKPEEVHFLGFRFRCAKVGEGYKVSVLLSRKTERRLMTTVREMTPPNWGRSMLHLLMHGKRQPLPDGLDIVLSALHVGSRKRIGRL